MLTERETLGERRVERPMQTEAVELLTGCLGYHALRGRRDLLSLTLKPHELRRLDECERLLRAAFGGVVAGSDATAAAASPDKLRFSSREEVRRTVDLRVDLCDSDGRLSDGIIRDVSVGGVFVATQLLRRPGERCRFRFVDPALRFEWLFAAEVAWVNYGGGGAGGFGPSPIALTTASTRAGALPRGTRRDGPLLLDKTSPKLVDDSNAAALVDRGMGFRFLGIPLELLIGHHPTDTPPLLEVA